MFPPKTKWLISLPSLFPEKRSNISNKNWESSLPCRGPGLIKYRHINWLLHWLRGSFFSSCSMVSGGAWYGPLFAIDVKGGGKRQEDKY